MKNFALTLFLSLFAINCNDQKIGSNVFVKSRNKQKIINTKILLFANEENALRTLPNFYNHEKNKYNHKSLSDIENINAKNDEDLKKFVFDKVFLLNHLIEEIKKFNKLCNMSQKYRKYKIGNNYNLLHEYAGRTLTQKQKNLGMIFIKEGIRFTYKELRDLRNKLRRDYYDLLKSEIAVLY